MSPGYIKDLHILIRAENNKIMGCIFGTPKRITIGTEVVRVVDCKWMTVHQNFAKKRMAPMLMRKLFLQSLRNGFQAGFYTTMVSVPTAFSFTIKMFRFLDAKKCVETSFCYKKSPEQSMGNWMNMNALKPKKQI